MGLIKTGLTLAGAYGLIKVASKAATEHEDKKQNRQNTSLKQYYPNYNPQMDHMNDYQMNNTHVQPSYPIHGPRSNHGNDVYGHSPQAQSRSIRQQSMGYTRTMENPPPYYQSHPCEIQGDGKTGSAQEYYKSK
ncbi:hypothetical protein ACN38_g7488 [Penicillium nordicum]|uniref:Uncharacterized protein n=1 Tax=Penicillium nordicum TaxID=229535 RepID=A0A0N0RYH1_9EURO|nr:hypothetical protein ACN38_g7488 [Penicillium nordicum]